MFINILDCIKSYPRSRTKLPLNLKKNFDNHYLKNRKNFLSQLCERWLHLSISKRFLKKKTLEIGAGTLNHLHYESCDKIYDIIEPKNFLLKSSNLIEKIHKKYNNIDSCKNNYYDRIISCAVLEHLDDLPRYLSISSLKIKKNKGGGYQSHSIPCEGYPVWNLTWYIFSGLIFDLKYGFGSFRKIQKHEHLNNFDEIIALIKFFYKKVKIKYSYPGYNKYLSFYANVEFKIPNKKNINYYLNNFKNYIE